MNQLAVLIPYVLIATFSPGPNNISSTAAGVRLGFKKSLPYLAGTMTGAFSILLLSGFLNTLLKNSYSDFSQIVKWAGFFYLLWLSISLFVHSKNNKTRSVNFSFISGVLLQLVNPKVILYGITLFGMFPELLLQNNFSILLSSLVFSAIGFSSVVTWCFIGTVISEFLNKPLNLIIFNLVISSLLFYTAITIVMH
ncbi:MAG: LysE family translocator [Spirochaetales bacterium]|nr:LysE family translocator [Spirochaetales bacterium]